MVKRVVISLMLLAGLAGPAVATAPPALAATAYVARGTISPFANPAQCIGLETSNDTLFSEPCIPGDARQIWTAFQMNGVLYVTLASDPVLCWGGQAVDGNHVGTYDCGAGLLVSEGMIIKGGTGGKNMIRNNRGLWLSWHGGTGPVTWSKAGTKIRKYKLDRRFTFNGEDTGGGWEEHTT